MCKLVNIHNADVYVYTCSNDRYIDICMYVCMYICMYIYTHDIHTYTCRYTHMHTCMHACKGTQTRTPSCPSYGHMIKVSYPVYLDQNSRVGARLEIDYDA